MNLQDILWVVIALPLAGAVFLHFFGRRIGEPRAGYLASLAIGGSFAIALGASLPFFSEGSHGSHIMLWEWMPAVGASFEITWDPLAALMTLVVTGVGCCDPTPVTTRVMRAASGSQVISKVAPTAGIQSQSTMWEPCDPSEKNGIEAPRAIAKEPAVASDAR